MQTPDGDSEAARLGAMADLAGAIGHDLNNYLAVLLGFSELLGEACKDEAAQPLLDRVIGTGHRLSRFTQALLAFAERVPVTVGGVDLDSLLAGTIAAMREAAGERVTVEVLGTARGSVVRADELRLREVLIELATNAGRAMPEGGRLEIEVRDVHGGAVEILVRDTGRGMGEETRRRAFEPLYTDDRRGAGTGFGLSMVYGVVRALGGEVRLDSAPGQGTTVALRLRRDGDGEGEERLD